MINANGVELPGQFSVELDEIAALILLQTAVSALDAAAASGAWSARDVKATARIRSTRPMVMEGRAKGAGHGILLVSLIRG